MFPPEGASPQVRLEATEVDVCLSIHNLGSDYLVCSSHNYLNTQIGKSKTSCWTV